MKSTLKSGIILAITVCMMFMPGLVLADEPAPPPPPESHGADGNQDPVGAPIDGGLGIIVVLAGSACYGGLKLFRAGKREKVGTGS
jgi:hypothetical protein